MVSLVMNKKNNRKVLIVSPHPDDETFSMGGTILKINQLGYETHLLVMSFGERSSHPVYTKDELKKIRKDEVIQASKKLGIASVEFAGLPDTMIKSDDAYKVIRETIRKLNPFRIYVPSNPDRHQDHLVTAKSGILAALHENVKEIFCYDSFSSAEIPNYYEDISDLLEKKLRICRVFKTQIPKRIFDIEKIRAKAFSRGLEANVHAAEGFKIFRMIN